MNRWCVVFDLDDTLYPEREYAISGFRAAARWAQREHNIKDIDLDMTRMLDEGLRGDIFNRVLTERLPGHAPDLVQRLLDAYRANVPQLTLFPDAARALDHFGARVPLGLVTDGPQQGQARKVAALGLEPRFAKIAYTDSFGGRAFWKPHPASFEAVADAMRGTASRFVYVGDNPSKDFVAPNAMGWHTIQIARPKDVHVGIHDGAKTVEGGEPHHIIGSLDELKDLLLV